MDEKLRAGLKPRSELRARKMVTARLLPDLVDQIDEIADREDATRTSVIETLLEDGLRRGVMTENSDGSVFG